MPLPAALAARLAKRGLLSQVSETPSTDPSISEEVIAESYDDENPRLSSAHDEPYDPATLLDHQDDGDADGPLVHESVNCPNLSNVYHSCVPYCRQRWGLKSFRHDPNMDRKRERLLRRYPIPLGCVEVADPETGRYYYWNTETDEVSWLPPQHPRASISLPQEKLKELMTSAASKILPSNKTGRKDHRDDSDVESDENSTDLDDEDDLDEEEPELEQVEKDTLKRKKQSEQDRGVVKKRGRDAKLDPMDPSSYSDVPRGNWSTGLELKGSAKTGADVTAAGPLFQQRPYPSPGAILRMNEGKK